MNLSLSGLLLIELFLPLLGVIYSLPINLRQDWRIASPPDKIVFQNTPQDQKTKAVFGAWIWLQSLVYFICMQVLTSGHPHFSAWSVFAIFSWCVFAIGWAFVAQSGWKQLEIDLEKRTYQYQHRPMFWLPRKYRRGSLDDFARVDLCLEVGLARVTLKLKRDGPSGSEYTIGEFADPFKAFEMANEIGTQLGLEIKISQGVLILPSTTAEKEKTPPSRDLANAAGIFVWAFREQTRVDLQFKNSDRRDILGSFNNRQQAIEMAKHTAADMGLPLLLRGYFDVNTTAPRVTVRTVTKPARK